MTYGSPTSRNPPSAAYCAETLANSAAVSPQPDITVAAIVVRDGRFLVVEERIGGRDVLNQPAGHLERGETLLAGGGARDAGGNRLDASRRAPCSAPTCGNRRARRARRCASRSSARSPATTRRGNSTTRHPGARTG